MMIGFGLLMSFATLVGCKAEKSTDEEAAAAADGTTDGEDGGEFGWSAGLGDDTCEVQPADDYASEVDF